VTIQSDVAPHAVVEAIARQRCGDFEHE
jgi:hypothetical protein